MAAARGASSKLGDLYKLALTKGEPAFKKFMYYARVELAPPKTSELSAVRTGISNIMTAAKTGRYRELTIKELWLNTLVGIEVLCWFYVGECIGKRHLVGYKV